MEIDAYLRVIRRWIWLITLMTIAAAGACYFLIQRQPPVYEAQVRLLVGPGVDNASSNLNVLRASSQVLQTYAELATTRNVLKQVIDDLHLDVTPSNLAGHITTTPDPNSGLLLIAVRSTDQEEAVAIANDLAKVLVGLRSEKANNGSGNTDEDLSAQVNQLQEESARIQGRIAQLESDLKAASAAGSQPPITDQEDKIKALEAQLAAPVDPVLAKQMQDHQARIQQLETSLRSTVNVDARRLILDELMREDSTVQFLTSQVNNQKRLLLDQLGQERNRLTSMQTFVSGKQSQILSQLGMERTRLADTQRALAALVPALQNAVTNQVTIIDPAVGAPPEADRSTLIMLVAALAGLVLALTLAFAFDYLDDKIRMPEQLEGTGARVWGWIGRQKILPPGPSTQSITPSPEGKMVEAFRRLSFELMSRVSSLLVANFEQGDTAAEIASNVAISLARAGNRVVLMDANIRQPTLGAWFHAEDEEGLADWLSSGMNGPNLVPIEWVPGLSVLPAGTVHSDSARELGWPRMEDLIKRVESQTDMLIIAGPPLSTSADSLFLASHLGGVLAVAQSGRTPRAMAAATIENLRMMGIQVLGLILTDGTRPFIRIPRPQKSHETPPLGTRRPSSTSVPPPNPKDKVSCLGPVTEARSGETHSGKNPELGTTKSNI